MKPKELRKLGSKLGVGWQTKLAHLLPCNPRTVRYWLAGKRAIRPMVAERIRQVCDTPNNREG